MATAPPGDEQQNIPAKNPASVLHHSPGSFLWLNGLGNNLIHVALGGARDKKPLAFLD
jgi:hypothetical protein